VAPASIDQDLAAFLFFDGKKNLWNPRDRLADSGELAFGTPTDELRHAETRLGSRISRSTGGMTRSARSSRFSSSTAVIAWVRSVEKN
jgi:hypothetical protein